MSAKCCCHESLESTLPNDAFMPPAANTVCTSSLILFPITVTSTPAFFASIAALSPAPPLPITNTFEMCVE